MELVVSSVPVSAAERPVLEESPAAELFSVVALVSPELFWVPEMDFPLEREPLLEDFREVVLPEVLKELLPPRELPPVFKELFPPRVELVPRVVFPPVEEVLSPELFPVLSSFVKQ